jgi:hypothetical protein
MIAAHWEGCWQDHHGCAQLRIVKLQSDLAQLRSNYAALAADVLGIESMSTVEWAELRERCKAIVKL